MQFINHCNRATDFQRPMHAVFLQKQFPEISQPLPRLTEATARSGVGLWGHGRGAEPGEVELCMDDLVRPGPCNSHRCPLEGAFE